MAIALVGALISGILLIASLSGSGLTVRSEGISQLVDAYEPTDNAEGPAPTGSTAGDLTEQIGLTIFSDPTMATVHVNFDSVGVTPLSPLSLRAGTYILTVSKPGYATYDTVVTLRAGEFPLYRFALRPWELPALDEDFPARRAEPLATTPLPAPARPRAVPETVREEPERSPTARRAQAAAADAVPDDEAASTPVAPEPAATGTLSILVRPWGSIYIDGDLHRSNTDMAYTVELPAGTHEVRAVHPALGTVQQAIRVNPATVERVVIDLDRRSLQSATAIPAPAPPPASSPSPEADSL